MTFRSLKKEFSLIQLLKSHIQATVLVRMKQKLLSHRELCWRVHKDGEDAKITQLHHVQAASPSCSPQDYVCWARALLFIASTLSGYVSRLLGSLCELAESHSVMPSTPPSVVALDPVVITFSPWSILAAFDLSLFGQTKLGAQRKKGTVTETTEVLRWGQQQMRGLGKF